MSCYITYRLLAETFLMHLLTKHNILLGIPTAPKEWCIDKTDYIASQVLTVQIDEKLMIIELTGTLEICS